MRKILQMISVFFSDKGMSMSEANHTANMTKEIADNTARTLSNTAGVTETIIFGGERIALDSNKSLPNLTELCSKEGELFALSAWLREAIKAKQAALDFIAKCNDIEFLSPEEREIPDAPVRPSMGPIPELEMISEQDVINEMDCKERAEYLMVEAQAAHIGKKIHDNGQVSQMRKSLKAFKSTRFHTLQSGGGPCDYPVTREKLYPEAVIDKVFFELQSQHRSLEARLNYFKAKIKNAVTERNAELSKTRADAFAAANAVLQAQTDQYNARMILLQNLTKELNLLAETRRLEKTKEIAALKIIIPFALEPTLEYVKSYQS